VITVEQVADYLETMRTEDPEFYEAQLGIVAEYAKTSDRSLEETAAQTVYELIQEGVLEVRQIDGATITKIRPAGDMPEHVRQFERKLRALDLTSAMNLDGSHRRQSLR